MGLRRLPALLLGVVVLSRTALGAVLLNNTVHTAHVKREQDSHVIPTYHFVNTDLLSDAIHCLYQWCDGENKLSKKGGMARCRTPGAYGAEVFICNPGPVQKCSGIQLAKAIAEIRMVGSETGVVHHKPDPEGEGIKFGFEYFCKKGHTLCPDEDEAYDATRKHCNDPFYAKRIFNYDHIADRRRGTGDYSYVGYSWLTEPTPSATQYTYGFKTLSPSAATPDVQFPEHVERRSVEEHIRQPRATDFPSVGVSIPDHPYVLASSGPEPTSTELASGDTIQSADWHVTKPPSGSSPETVIPSATSLPRAV